MVTLYIYNCNNKNEFLEKIQTDNPEQWGGCSTEVSPKGSTSVGKSWAYNPKTNDWDIQIDDWRGYWVFLKSDSTLKKEGELGPLNEFWTAITPPDEENKYVFNDETEQWEAYVEVVDPQKIIKQYEDAIQKHIDEVAQARGYDNGYTCASYFDDKNARYASDARIFKDWRSDVWVYVNQLLNQYSSQFEGVSEVPATSLGAFPTIQDIISALPTITWEEL